MNNSVIYENRKAYHDYLILERLEVGIVLTGAEVKAAKRREANLQGSYISVVKNELWLIGSNINVPKRCFFGWRVPGGFRTEGFDNDRDRKLLCHKKELRNLKFKTEAKGLTVIPLKLYEKDGLIKIEIGIVKGKNKSDKRNSLKEKSIKKEMRYE